MKIILKINSGTFICIAEGSCVFSVRNMPMHGSKGGGNCGASIGGYRANEKNAPYTSTSMGATIHKYLDSIQFNAPACHGKIDSERI